MEEDEFDANEGNYPLAPPPELPLGHLTYKEACYDAYKKLFWYLFWDRMPLSDKLALLQFILFKR